MASESGPHAIHDFMASKTLISFKNLRVPGVVVSPENDVMCQAGLSFRLNKKDRSDLILILGLLSATLLFGTLEGFGAVGR